MSESYSVIILLKAYGLAFYINTRELAKPLQQDCSFFAFCLNIFKIYRKFLSSILIKHTTQRFPYMATSEKTHFEVDAELIQQLRQGNKEAFSKIYYKYVDIIYGHIFAIVKDHIITEDITQFCFMQLWIHRRDIADNKCLGAYLYIIGRNKAYKEFRKQASSKTYNEYLKIAHNEWNQAVTEPECNIDFRLLRAEIQKVLESLPPTRREIWDMKTIEGLTAKEIAQQLDISQKTVETQLYRVKLALKKVVSNLFLISFTELIWSNMHTLLEVLTKV